MAWLFVIGVGVGNGETTNDGTAALAALASWLMITNLLDGRCYHIDAVNRRECG